MTESFLASSPQRRSPPRSGTKSGFAQGDHSELGNIMSLLLFTVPGVTVGGQIGSAVARYIPQRTIMVGIGILFILVAALMLGEAILNVR